MSFSLQTLSTQLSGLLPASCKGGRLVVALSGGLDSCVLLHALHRVQEHFPLQSLTAIHVNHGLSPNSPDWEGFCVALCQQLEIPLQVSRVFIASDAPGSLENCAREKRYEVFSNSLAENDCLVMAHHLDDQAETFLLRSLRGASPKGLGAIPDSRPLGKGLLVRPMLIFSRAELAYWAQQQSLAWIEDESNDSILFDRNYCRHEVLPRIEKRWPAFRDSWQRCAQLCAETDILLMELAAQDYESVVTVDPAVINCVELSVLSEPRQRNLLRYWLNVCWGIEPGWNILTRIFSELVAAAVDAQPELRWQSGEEQIVLRRYQGMLYLQRDWTALPVGDHYLWSPLHEMQLPGNGTVHITPAREGLRISEQQHFTLRYRQGGETCRLVGRRSRKLKKILQDAGIAPWMRERIPLVYADDALVFIPGVGVCDGWQAIADEPAWEVIWAPPKPARNTDCT